MNRWFFRIFRIHIFKVTASLRCVKWNFAGKSCRRRGVSRERHTSLAIGWRGVIIMWGVTAGKASHNASNAWGITAGKMGRNSSNSNPLKVLQSIKTIAIIPIHWNNCNNSIKLKPSQIYAIIPIPRPTKFYQNHPLSDHLQWLSQVTMHDQYLPVTTDGPTWSWAGLAAYVAWPGGWCQPNNTPDKQTNMYTLIFICDTLTNRQRTYDTEPGSTGLITHAQGSRQCRALSLVSASLCFHASLSACNSYAPLNTDRHLLDHCASTCLSRWTIYCGEAYNSDNFAARL